MVGQVPLCICEDLRTSFSSQLSLSVVQVPGFNLGHQAWQQALSPTESVQHGNTDSKRIKEKGRSFSKSEGDETNLNKKTLEINYWSKELQFCLLMYSSISSSILKFYAKKKSPNKRWLLVFPQIFSQIDL